LPAGNVEPALAIMRDCEKHVEVVTIDLETVNHRFGRRRGIGIGNIEEQPIRENPAGSREGERAGGKRLVIDVQSLKSPWTEAQSVNLKLERIFDEPVLDLEM